MNKNFYPNYKNLSCSFRPWCEQAFIIEMVENVSEDRQNWGWGTLAQSILLFTSQVIRAQITY